jgi:3',5'-cyclic AMP phosphodiesterase CpdA
MADRSFRLAFLADTQLGLYASFSGYTEDDSARYAELGMRVPPVPHVTGFEWDAAQYERAVEMVNGLRPDLVIVGGDMIDDPNSDDQTEAFFAITARIDPDITVRYVPGNHDIAPDTVAPTSEEIHRYRERFGPDHYRLEAGPLTFMVLNTPLIDHPEFVEDAWERQNGFIEDTLSSISPDDRMIVVGHHPLFIEQPDEPDTYWNLPLVRRLPLYARLRAAGVRLGLAGHWHRNNIAIHEGFEMITSGPVGYPLGEDPSGIRILDVYPDAMTHHYLPLPE